MSGSSRVQLRPSSETHAAPVHAPSVGEQAIPVATTRPSMVAMSCTPGSLRPSRLRSSSPTAKTGSSLVSVQVRPSGDVQIAASCWSPRSSEPPIIHPSAVLMTVAAREPAPSECDSHRRPSGDHHADAPSIPSVIEYAVATKPSSAAATSVIVGSHALRRGAARRRDVDLRAVAGHDRPSGDHLISAVQSPGGFSESLHDCPIAIQPGRSSAVRAADHRGLALTGRERRRRPAVRRDDGRQRDRRRRLLAAEQPVHPVHHAPAGGDGEAEEQQEAGGDEEQRGSPAMPRVQDPLAQDRGPRRREGPQRPRGDAPRVVVQPATSPRQREQPWRCSLRARRSAADRPKSRPTAASSRVRSWTFTARLPSRSGHAGHARGRGRGACASPPRSGRWPGRSRGR